MSWWMLAMPVTFLAMLFTACFWSRDRRRVYREAAQALLFGAVAAVVILLLEQLHR